jgi:hypothetical protein
MSSIANPYVKSRQRPLFVAPPEMKVCKDCGATKPRSEFTPHKGYRDGLVPYCKMCANKRTQESYSKHGEFIRAKRRAKYAQERGRQLPMVVERATLVSGPPCRVCGKALNPYDLARGECFRHPLARIRAGREDVNFLKGVTG